MALAGTLHDFSLPDILQLISIQKKTGVLTLKSDKDVVTISFLNGEIVSADSLHKRVEDRLGHVLVKSGRLSREDLGRALDMQKQTLQRLGHILVRENFMTKEALQESLQSQVAQIIYRLFRWRDGDYSFSPEETIDYDSEFFVPLGTDSLLMDGVRMLDEWPMIERKITSFDMVFQKMGERDVDVLEGDRSGVLDLKAEDAAGKASLNPLESRVYDLINGIFTVQEIIDRAIANEFETSKALFDLWNRGMIEESGAAKAQEEQHAQESAQAQGMRLQAALRLLSVVMFGFLTLSASLSWINPANAWAFGLARSERRIEQDRARLHRVEKALLAYYSQTRTFPPSLNNVTGEGGYLRLPDLKDTELKHEIKYLRTLDPVSGPAYTLSLPPPPGAPAQVLEISGGAP